MFSCALAAFRLCVFRVPPSAGKRGKRKGDGPVQAHRPCAFLVVQGGQVMPLPAAVEERLPVAQKPGAGRP